MGREGDFNAIHFVILNLFQDLEILSLRYTTGRAK